MQFEPIAYENDISIDADIQEGINVRGDQTQLKQLLHILLDNACKYAGEKGKVKFSMKRRQNNTVLSVYNSGAYIPKEDLPHIFERFYRADKARTREGGFGLGLAIAKSIVANMGGDISAESSESTGTVFTVRFGK